jgi:Anaerobic ribonucleoside-triphosphate reductase
MEYSCAENEIIADFNRFKCSPGKNKFKEYMRFIPDSDKKFKCFNCYTVFKIDNAQQIKCPKCDRTENIKEACPLEQFHSCAHPVSDTIAYCPICKQAICPQCKTNHDVMQISRVTGYLQDVSGFNAGKAQELRDRKRYDI